MYAAGIAHLDIKPSNFVVDEACNVYHIDFGLCSLEGKEPYKGRVGTAAFMAPEMIAGNSAVAMATDIWSAGVMLCIMLTGEIPFEGSAGTVRLDARHLHVLCYRTPDAKQLTSPCTCLNEAFCCFHSSILYSLCTHTSPCNALLLRAACHSIVAFPHCFPLATDEVESQHATSVPFRSAAWHSAAWQAVPVEAKRVVKWMLYPLPNDLQLHRF